MWSAFCSGRAQVRIKNSSKHIVISHLATLISTAPHSHCSAELAHFPEEFNRSLSLSVLFPLSSVPPTSSSLQTPFISEFAFFFYLSPLSMLFDLHPSSMFSKKKKKPLSLDPLLQLSFCLLIFSPGLFKTPCSSPFSCHLYPFVSFLPLIITKELDAQDL